MVSVIMKQFWLSNIWRRRTWLEREGDQNDFLTKEGAEDFIT